MRVLRGTGAKSCANPAQTVRVAVAGAGSDLLTRNPTRVRQWRCGMAELIGPGSVALIMSVLIWLLARVSLDSYDEQERVDFR